MASISSQLEELYMSHSRKDMNDTLTEVLLAACVTPALMPDRLLMEHVLLVSIIHHSVGLEVNISPCFAGFITHQDCDPKTMQQIIHNFLGGSQFSGDSCAEIR